MTIESKALEMEKAEEYNEGEEKRTLIHMK